MANRNCCTFPSCDNPKNKERNAGLCTEHSERWIQSDAFRAAIRDEKVRFAMSLSEKMGRGELAKHCRRWAKAEAAREDGE
jgi:hypothetical protein